MKIKIQAAQVRDGEAEIDLHDDYKAPNGLEEYEDAQSIFTDRMKNVSRMVMLDGILLGFGFMEIMDDFTMANDADMPHLEMQFQLQGCSTYSGDAIKNDALYVCQGHHCLFFSSGEASRLFIPHIATGHRFLGVRILPHVLERYYGADNGGVLRDFWTNVNNRKSYVARFGDTTITPRMYEVIHAIMDCPYQGQLKRMYLEAKVMELLTFQLSEICARTDMRPAFNERLKAKLHHVKEIIEADYPQSHSLRQLALECGMNEFDLKRHFKQLYNQTVFGMITDVRLRHARHLILEEDRSIAEATYLVGYKTPQHFSTAFKKKYGFPPSLLKR